MDGLQLIWPRVSMLCVSSSVFAPMRAEASAASVPAWPPPTTITSKDSGYNMAHPGAGNSAKGAILRRRRRKAQLRHELFHGKAAIKQALVFSARKPVSVANDRAVLDARGVQTLLGPHGEVHLFTAAVFGIEARRRGLRLILDGLCNHGHLHHGRRRTEDILVDDEQHRRSQEEMVREFQLAL